MGKTKRWLDRNIKVVIWEYMYVQKEKDDSKILGNAGMLFFAGVSFFSS